MIPEFYDEVGQHLRPWAPPPPSIDKEDPIEEGDADYSVKRLSQIVALPLRLMIQIRRWGEGIQTRHPQVKNRNSPT